MFKRMHKKNNVEEDEEDDRSYYESGEIPIENDRMSIHGSVRSVRHAGGSNKALDGAPLPTKQPWFFMFLGIVGRTFRASMNSAFGVYYVEFMLYFGVTRAAASWMKTVEQAFSIVVGE